MDTFVFQALSPEERRRLINDPRVVRIRAGCAITERRELDRIASELHDTVQRQAQQIERLELMAADPGHRFAARLALLLECMMLDSHGHFNEAGSLLDEYKQARQEYHEKNGEPYVSGFGKD